MLLKRKPNLCSINLGKMKSKRHESALFPAFFGKLGVKAKLLGGNNYAFAMQYLSFYFIISKLLRPENHAFDS